MTFMIIELKRDITRILAAEIVRDGQEMLDT